ncbi:MAG: capsule assembly Wzi family protein [Chitinophagia bacterium]
MKRQFFIYLLFICLLSYKSNAQQVIIGSLEEDSLRIAQLAGKFSSQLSFSVRPVELHPTKISWRKPVFKILPATVITQFNSAKPFGWNDGAMIAANGLQIMGRTGIYARYGIIEVQLAPEWVYAANKEYENSPEWGSNAGGLYNKIFPGQSSAGIRIGSLSLGISTQNLWWGPGQRSSLLMSNNAPGFLHAYIRSNRPAKTPIGTFEWQLIGARLDSDSSRPYENMHLKLTPVTYPSSWRYQSAFVITYQPKWIPGLFLGMTRTLQRYQKDIGLGGTSFLSRYVPVITKAFLKQNEQNDDAENTDQLASFFFRWLLPKSGWEFYGEWGYNDYNQNVRDYVMDATHSVAYIIGASKLYELRKHQLWVGVESLQQSESASNLLRGAGNWYVHGGDNGYTHWNQIIGAGVGYGANLQSVWAKIINTQTKYSLLCQLNRINRDPNNYGNKWVDYAFSIQPFLQKKQIIVSPAITYIYSRNAFWLIDNVNSNWNLRLHVFYNFTNK